MVLGVDAPVNIIVLGVIAGLAYALIAAGLVLIYRATRVINFAQGEIGAFGAALLAKLVMDDGWPYLAAFVLVMAVGGAVGAIVELTVIRRLFNAPRAILMVATIGIAQLMFFAQLALPEVEQLGPYPTPFSRHIDIGTLRLSGGHFSILIVVPAIVVGLSLFLTRTPWGIALRSAADNAEAARLLGISPRRMSTLVWVLAGVLAVVGAMLVNPVRGVVVGIPAAALGPGLMLRALAAALVGRLESLPQTLAGALGIGVFEALLLHNVPSEPGLTDAALGVLVLVLVLLRGARARTGDDGTWSFAPIFRPVPEALHGLRWVRISRRLAWAGAVLVALALPLVITSASRTFMLSSVVIFSIIGISITILTGWAGLLSFGAFAFVGLGALTTAWATGEGAPFAVAVMCGVAVGVLAALIVGAPALRVRGVYLAIATLAFAVGASRWLFEQPFWFHGGLTATVERPTLGPIDFSSQRSYYYLCVAVLFVTVRIALRLQRGGVGRTFIAVRDNERGARAFTITPSHAKLLAFGISGGLAALAGGLYAGLHVSVSGADFSADESLRVVAMAIIGGLGSILGGVLGAVYVVGLPALFGETAEVRLLTSGAGLLILLLYFPGGLAAALYRMRDVFLGWIARRHPAAELVGPVVERPATRLRHGDASSSTHAVVSLSVTDVTVKYGGRLALDAVSVEARRGETVGLIGANGAGKSTMLDVIGGYIVPHSGSVHLGGRRVGTMTPERRARLGLGRVFQDARLFSSLTVQQTVEVALEGSRHTSVTAVLCGLPSARRRERQRTSDATAILEFFGLTRYAQTLILELSTGTRRIVELACLFALDAHVLLLDEPTAGLAQRETEAFGPLITRIRDELDATVVVVEHDMPLVMSISDRIYCLDAGRVIADGAPNVVRSHPAVIAAYLGTDERAIARSGTSVGNGKKRSTR